MSLLTKGVRSVFTAAMSSTSRNVLSFTISNSLGNLYPYAVKVSVIGPDQAALINRIHRDYSIHMAGRKYESIPRDYGEFVVLMGSLESVSTEDSTLKILLQIAQDALAGALNISTMYETIVYNEIQILTLNNRVDEILSDKNVKKAFSGDDAKSTYMSEKKFKLSPVISYYIHLYGLPQFGEGFDTDKLLLLYIQIDNIRISESALNAAKLATDAAKNADDASVAATNLATLADEAALNVASSTVIEDVIAATTTAALADAAALSAMNAAKIADANAINASNIAIEAAARVSKVSLTLSSFLGTPLSLIDTSGAIVFTLDVKIVNSALGLIKNEVNNKILSTTYQSDNDRFVVDAIEISSSTFFKNAKVDPSYNGVGDLWDIPNDFQALVYALDVPHIDIFKSNTIYFTPDPLWNPRYYFDSSAVSAMLVLGTTLRDLTTSSHGGSIIISNIADNLRDAVSTNPYGNRTRRIVKELPITNLIREIIVYVMDL